MRQDIARALKAVAERRCTLDSDGALKLTALTVPAPAVVAMVQEGLLARRGDTVWRTSEGRAFLRRALSGAGDDAFASQHRVLETRTIGSGAEAATVRANAAESPLQWLATRKSREGAPLIDSAQLQAGQRLSRDFERAHRRERITQSWDASGVRGEGPRDRPTIGDAAEAARRRVTAALEAVGPGLADILVAVCCEERGLEATEQRFRWPPRSGKVVLKLALDRLAIHYGIAMSARGETARLVHWGGEGYRPHA